MNSDFDWNSVPCGIVYCSIHTNSEESQYRIDYCNQIFLESTMQSEEIENMCGRDLLSMILEADRERFLFFISEIMAANTQVCSIECNVKASDGKSVCICWRGRNVEDKGILFSTLNFDAYKRERTMLLDAVHDGQAELNRLTNLVTYLPVGVAIYKEDHGFLLRAANAQYYRLIGFNRIQIMESNVDLFDCIYSLDRSLLREALEECRTTNTAKNIKIRMLEANGDIHWVIMQCNVYPIKPEEVHFSLACWDITEQKELEDELHLLAEQYHLLEELVDEIPLEYHVEKRKFRIPIRSISNAKKRQVEYIDFEKVLEHIHPEDKESFLHTYEEASKEEKKGSIDFRIQDSRCKTKKEYFWYRTIYRSVTDGNGKIAYVIGKAYDVTADKERQIALTKETTLDPLTRVYNKVESQKRIDECLLLEKNGKHALFLIDVDNFKRINDVFGHTVGDAIIKDLSNQIKESFRNSDIVGRIGGDEFVVFMKNTTKEFAHIKATQLCQNVQKVVYGDDEKLQVTISVGIALYKEDGMDYATLYENADTAMYKVKNKSKNGYAFFDEKDNEVFYEKKSVNAIITSTEHVDREILNLAFNLLAHARDLDVSLNLLLEQIGKRFDANMVGVFIYNQNQDQMTLTNIWSNIGKIYESQTMPRDWMFFDDEPIGVFVDVNKVAKKAGVEKPFALENWDPNREPIRSMSCVKFTFGNDIVGEIDLGSVKPDVEWDDENRETMEELARVVRVFVSLRTKIMEDRQTIHMLKHRERLTGLYDRITFRDKVEKELANRNPNLQYAVIMLDINNFSFVNEYFGNNIGDKILCDLADSLMHTNSVIKLASRMYSDYFSAFLSADKKEKIIEVVEKGTKTFVESLNQKYPMGRLSISVGLCFFEESDDFEKVMENANIARKYAKEHKMNTSLVYSEYMREKRDELAWVSAKFHEALKNGEFQMYLQPKFLIGTMEIYGAEALARWIFKDGTVVGPNHFIPALEANGYIIELDFYIFETLLKTMKDWMLQGKKSLVLSTNFSRKHFEKDGEEFLRRIQRALDYYRVPAANIEIEITESMVVDNLDVLQRCMEELKRMGFRIAIDDFGTGYSSLNAVLEIPADVIKMDKSFTDSLEQERKRRFVSKMGLLIKAAQQEVLFEGIETKGQLQYLQSSGFQYGQGYLFDKPISVTEFEKNICNCTWFYTFHNLYNRKI